jgi:2,3-bisphosphoglycerate-independent phosphoglycerate mutase
MAGSSQGKRKSVWVVREGGERQRFLRGIVTHHLVQRGVDFDDAYAIARAVRDRVSGRDEVSIGELRAMVDEQISGLLGFVPAPASPAAGSTPLSVRYGVQNQPYSRGLLAQSIVAAGPDIDRAYALIATLEGQLQHEHVRTIDSSDLARRVASLLEEHEGKDTAVRYWAIRRLHRLPRPLVVYLGGASGTGKSTLALELAPLLRIYRVNSTDTIRQVMRMLFAPAILPALHTSSFEVAEEAERDAEPGSVSAKLLSAFTEQATRVCVGVRAVVERAIAENMSVVVEGVHLVPGLVPFPDLEGACYQVHFLLGTEDEETHRTRFAVRSSAGVRRAERYLLAFPAIRAIHDHLQHEADTRSVPVVDTSIGEPPVRSALQIITRALRERLPQLGDIGEGRQSTPTPTLLLIIDGLGDRPTHALGGRTPLEAARTPNLDRLAREGRSGLADAVAPGVVPDTASGTLALLGQSPHAIRRGPIEALGAGLELGPGDVALRGNFATLDDHGRILDRRAGRIREGAVALAKAIDRLALPGELGDHEVRVAIGTEHRLAVVLKGEGLSPRIRGSDPGDGAPNGLPVAPHPLDPTDEAAVLTSRLLSVFEQRARDVLATHTVNLRRQKKGKPVANAILTRGAGRVHRLIPLEHRGVPLRLVCISGDRTVLGVASWLGAEVIRRGSMTGNLDTDLGAKFDAAIEALDRADLVVVHVKGADIASHDRRPDLKAGFIEAVDDQLGRLLEARSDQRLRVVVASDHATLSESGLHAADSPPVLLWGEGIDADSVTRFDERSARAGGLHRFPLQTLMGRLFERD